MDELLTIQQMAERTNLSVHTLRYYERIGLIHPVNRAGNGHRRYTEWDVGWVEFLKKLRATGMPIREMQRYAELQALGDSTVHERLTILEDHQKILAAKLDELTQYMSVINYKVNYYRQEAAEYDRAQAAQPEPALEAV